jgi:chemotaxis protein MotB
MPTLLLVVFATVAWIGRAEAERRVALVIGNGAYHAVGALQNPVNDADLITTALKTIGFAVTTTDNLRRDDFLKTLRTFRDIADNSDWALVYYAGHGIEMSGVNYLIPVDAALAQDRDVADEAIPLDRVLAAIEGARGIRVVVLDACRNNPFLATMKRNAGGRDIGRGLARVETTDQSMLIVFSAKDGSIAQDGKGANSPFATALAKHLTDPVDVQKMLNLVRDDVVEATAHEQLPFVYGSLSGRQNFYLGPSPPGASPAGQAASDPTEITFWNSIAASKDKLDFEAYLAKFPSGNFVALAHNRLAALGEVAPPSTDTTDLAAAHDRIAKLQADLTAVQNERDRMRGLLDTQSKVTASDRVAALTADLENEKNVSQKALSQVELLNQQIAALRRQIAALEAAIGASEERDKESQTTIADLGKRLNTAMAQRVQELSRYRSDFFGRLREILGDRPDIRVVGDRFVFQSEVLFASGSDEINDQGHVELDKLAGAVSELIKEIPDDIGWVLQVNGHTDKRPITGTGGRFNSNWDLSAARAIAVVRYLTDKGIPPAHLAAAGFGEFQPIYDGDTSEALAKNRRIELKLTER